jgi:WD40-like Beta Propeller Repeat
VHDRQTGGTTRASVAQDGAQANGESFAPAISGDGRYVVFSSSASNLVANATTRISIALGEPSQTQAVPRPRFSADGNVVAYASKATNLVPGGDSSSTTWTSVICANSASRRTGREAGASSVRLTTGSPGPRSSTPSPFRSTNVACSVDPRPRATTAGRELSAKRRACGGKDDGRSREPPRPHRRMVPDGTWVGMFGSAVGRRGET